MNITRQPRAIIVWRFQDAPEDLRSLSTNGGDEWWIVVLPPHIERWEVGWLYSPVFGEPQEIPQPDGSRVVIVSHA